MKEELIRGRFMQGCDDPVEESAVEPATFVIFGGAGDLSKRKLIPTLFRLWRERDVLQDFSVIGFGRRALSDEQYRSMMRSAVEEFGGESVDERLWDEFGKRLFFLSARFEDEQAYVGLRELVEKIGPRSAAGVRHVVYYLAVPPDTTPVIAERLKRCDLCRGTFRTKVVVEKPFGHDRLSASGLNRVFTDAFDESQIYRIDHYLGKEPVQNIIFFRFSNTLFEEIWNRRHIDNVQITVAEEIGIEHRGVFYEQAGVVRDIVQNHMMQLLGLVAMEPPVAFQADFIRDEKLKILSSIRAMSADQVARDTVRGQYGQGMIGCKDVPGYRHEENVLPQSVTPTFFAGRFYIDNLRWAGVPFYLRTGKRLSRRVTEISLQVKQLPLRLFGRTCDVMEPNIFSLTVQPDEKIALRFNVKHPHATNQLYPAQMVFSYPETFKTSPHAPYERLLIDCLRGDLTLFMRQDEVEAMWGIVDPIIAQWEHSAPMDFPNYAAGSSGPEAASRLLEQEGRSWITELSPPREGGG